jgi:Holliday junction resolvase
MAINSRTKGKRAELEIASILRGYGYEARRTAQYCGNTGEASDVVGVDGLHIEVKRREQFSDEPSLQQAERDARKGEIPVVFYRRSREKWKATMRMDMFMLIWNELTDLQKYQIREKIKFSVKSEKIGKQP